MWRNFGGNLFIWVKRRTGVPSVGKFSWQFHLARFSRVASILKSDCIHACDHSIS